MNQIQLQDIRQLAHATVVSAVSMEEAVRQAQQLAAAALCLSAGPVPCGSCRACRKVAAGIHPDLIRVERETDDKGRQKKEIGVDQIRRVAADACVLPNESERKVYLIVDADAMNGPAQNAALKLLEEPPAGVYFLLCVSNPSLLLPTVRSRCAARGVAEGEELPDPELRKSAEEYLRLTAEGDRAALYRWCAENELMDNRTAAAFFACAAQCAAERLTGRAPAGGLSRARLTAVLALLERCRDWLRVNTGVRHLFGLLAVDSIAEEESKGVQH